MKNVLWVFAIVLACATWIGGTVFLRSRQESAASSSPSSPDEQATVPSDEGPFKTVSNPDQPSPRAVVDETRFDFGLMDPVTVGSHTFVIKNEGQAPLKLKQGPTTCKCTLSKVSGGEVAPGESAEVRLEWNTGTPQVLFEHSSTVWTNDPANDAIQLAVVGVVRRVFGSEFLQIPFANVSPGERRSDSTLLYSQVWDDFEILEVHITMPGLEHTVDSASPDDLEKQRALSGYRLTVTIPGDLPSGPFGDYIFVKVRPKDGSDPAVEMPLYVGGEVLPSISVVGEAVADERLVQLGDVRRTDGAKATLSMLVRDLDRELQIQDVSASPDFLQVRVEPLKREPTKRSGQAASRLRVYRIHLALPPGLPSGNYTGPDAGHFAIKCDHPKVPEVKMAVEFVVEE